MRGNDKQLPAKIFVVTVIAMAYACRILGKFDIGGVYTNYIRSGLYLLLFAWWGYTLDRRIIQRQVLHCLRLTAALMLLWLILRTLKYDIVTGAQTARYLCGICTICRCFFCRCWACISPGRWENRRRSA